jgi:WD40 repeat protein
VQELRNGDPAQVGPYRMLGRLGTGGMGRVFLGRSVGGRLVAVKVIRDELASDPEFRTRFRQEVAGARLVSGLYTAPVVDADLDGPVPWLATAYVDGPSLAGAVTSNGPLPALSVLALAAALAEGLAAIHAAEVVHRDLKPSNVLLAADGPRIIDFGIAKAAEATSLTQSGLVIGSPGFMSPEQAEGRAVGPPSDVFSLGAVLTFAATGGGPFGTGYATALMYRVVHSAPDLDKVPYQVRGVIEDCLAKDPALRPTTARLLAGLGGADLAADWLPGPFTRRHPAVPARAGDGRVAGPVPAGPAPAGPAPAGPVPADAVSADAVSADAVSADAVLASAGAAVVEDQPTGLIPGARARRRGAAGSLLARLDHEAVVTSVLFSSRGERMLTVSGKTVRLWSSAIEKVAQLPHRHDIRDGGVAFSPDGRTIATRTAPLFGRNFPVFLWEAGEGTQTAELPHRHEVNTVAFSPASTRIATVFGKTSWLWDSGTGREIARQRHAGEVSEVFFSRNGMIVVAITYSDSRPSLLDATTGEEIAQLPHRSPVRSAAFSPDGRRLLSYSADRTAHLWDVAIGREVPWGRRARMLDAASGREQPWAEKMADWTAAFSPSSGQLATASLDQVVRLWDPASGQETARLAQDGPARILAFSPDGNLLVTVSDGKTVRVWDPRTGRELNRLHPGSTITMVTFNPDSTRLISCGTDRMIWLWDLASGRAICQVRYEEHPVFSPDRTRLATGRGPVVRVLDLATGMELAGMAHSGPVSAVVFSPDSARLATGCGRTVALWTL